MPGLPRLAPASFSHSRKHLPGSKHQVSCDVCQGRSAWMQMVSGVALCEGLFEGLCTDQQKERGMICHSLALADAHARSMVLHAQPQC